VVVALLLAVGVAGTAIALKSREGNAQFVAQQQGLLPASAAAVQRLLITTNDPRPGRRGRARAARCRSVRAGASAGQWSCLVLYPHLPRMRYRVTVRANRSIVGVGRSTGTTREAESSVSGCCVGAP
jgi:hypothetical protein